MKAFRLLFFLFLLSIFLFALSACDSVGDVIGDLIGDVTSEQLTATTATTPPDNTTEATQHTHAFGEWSVIKEADETEEGLEERGCVCGKKETRKIEKLYVSEGLAFALNDEGDGYYVVGIGSCTDTDLIIPSMYNGLPVTAIGKDAFRGNSTITGITTGGGVVDIESYAFYGCTSLKTLILSDSLVSIQEYAFKNCSSLTNLVGGKGFKEFPLTAFNFCDAISNITMDEQNPYYTSIDGNFYDKSVSTLIRYAPGKSATHFEIPDTVKRIGEESLYAAEHLVSVTIPDSVTRIGNGAFWNCSSLTDVYYTGSEEQWNQIVKYNGLTSATIHYNYTPEE